MKLPAGAGGLAGSEREILYSAIMFFRGIDSY